MFKKLSLIIIFCFSLIQFSCSNASKDSELNESLNLSKTNISELGKVLSQYSDKDSLKYKAAVFIIKNMSGQYSKTFTDYDMFSTVFDSLNFYDEQFQISIIISVYAVSKNKLKIPKPLSIYNFLILFFLIGAISGFNKYFNESINDKLILGFSLIFVQMATVFAIIRIIKLKER